MGYLVSLVGVGPCYVHRTPAPMRRYGSLSRSKDLCACTWPLHAPDLAACAQNSRVPMLDAASWLATSQLSRQDVHEPYDRQPVPPEVRPGGVDRLSTALIWSSLGSDPIAPTSLPHGPATVGRMVAPRPLACPPDPLLRTFSSSWWLRLRASCWPILPGSGPPGPPLLFPRQGPSTTAGTVSSRGCK